MKIQILQIIKFIFSYGIFCILLAQNSSFVCFELLYFALLVARMQ